jgi:hypothetical protein
MVGNCCFSVLVVFSFLFIRAETGKLSPVGNLTQRSGALDTVLQNNPTRENLVDGGDHALVCEEEMMMHSEDCQDIEEEDCGECESVGVERCSMELAVTFAPVKVTECRKVHSCPQGVTQKCVTKYRKECSQQKLIKEKMLDFPMCGIIMVQNCSSCMGCDEEERKCSEVPVMKCHMKKKMTKKEVEEPVCRSVPEENCEDCEKCYQTVRLKRVLQPKKTCRIIQTAVCNNQTNTKQQQYNKSEINSREPKRDSSAVRFPDSDVSLEIQDSGSNSGSDSGVGCTLVTRTVCKPRARILIKKLCSRDYDWMLHQLP